MKNAFRVFIVLNLLMSGVNVLAAPAMGAFSPDKKANVNQTQTNSTSDKTADMVKLETILQDGDVIFCMQRSNEDLAIERATHSKYTRVGIVFINDNKPYILGIDEKVARIPLDKWIYDAYRRQYIVKRYKAGNRFLSEYDKSLLVKVSAAFYGKPRDELLKWSDEGVYCSELVWKIYFRALGITIGRPQKLRDLDLSSTEVKAELKRRFGEKIPLDEKIITPEAIFGASNMVTIFKP